jgi:hypothetical protein
MEHCKKAVRTAVYETRLLVFSSKFLLLSVLSFIIMNISISSIRQFALDYHLTMPPAVLPFYFSDLIFGNIVYLFLIFLFSDVPLRQKGQTQILQRCGLLSFGMGQMLSMLFVSVIFVAEQFVFSVIVCLPCLSFGEWGKTWGSVASHIFLEAGYTSPLSVSGDVLRNYSVSEAIILSMVSFFLTGFSYSLIVFLLNGISKSRLGVAVLSFWSVVWIFLRSSENEFIRKLMKIAPQNLNDLAIHSKKEFVILLFLLLIIIAFLIMINMTMVKKRKIL